MKLIILPGQNKQGLPEPFESIYLESGKIYTIVGKTGAGKTQLIEDIETFADGDGITKRVIQHNHWTEPKVAYLSQKMNFILDLTVLEFIQKRAPLKINAYLDTANSLCGEELLENQKLTQLSGGQSRSLMIADILYHHSPEVVLIDEIENAGIDKMQAIQLLKDHQKLILVITHDPLLALMGEERLLVEQGAIVKCLKRTNHEISLVSKLFDQHNQQEVIRRQLRSGQHIQQA